jgi:hypothetical protein
MRKLLSGAAILAAVLAPSVANANGYVGLDYGSVNVDGEGTEDGFGASGAFVVTPNIALDAAVAEEDSSWAATAHLFTNNSSYLFGGFLGVDDNGDSTSLKAGLEGQYYAANTTIAGAIGYGTNDDSTVDIWIANGEVRLFSTENFRIEGGFGWVSVNPDNGGAADALSLGLGGEYLFTAAPMSIGLALSNTQSDEDDLKVNAVTATVRYNFGGGSLLDRDRSGGGLAGLSGVAGIFGL